jgi:catalase
MVSVRILGALGAMAFAAFGLSDRSAAQEVDPAELVKDIHAIFGEHHARAVHAKGVVLEATFEPTEDARQLSKAPVLRARSRRPSAFPTRRGYRRSRTTIPMPARTGSRSSSRSPTAPRWTW